jgi:hypothetical protein
MVTSQELSSERGETIFCREEREKGSPAVAPSAMHLSCCFSMLLHEAFAISDNSFPSAHISFRIRDSMLSDSGSGT